MSVQTRLTEYIFGQRREVVINARPALIGKLAIGAEFRLHDGTEGTVTRVARPSRGDESVEAVVEPHGQAKLFPIGTRVMFLGTYSPNYRGRNSR